MPKTYIGKFYTTLNALGTNSGYVFVANNTLFHVGMICYLVPNDTTNSRMMVTEIVNTNSLGMVILPDNESVQTSYGRTSMVPYTTGCKVCVPGQWVDVPVSGMKQLQKLS